VPQRRHVLLIGQGERERGQRLPSPPKRTEDGWDFPHCRPEACSARGQDSFQSALVALGIKNQLYQLAVLQEAFTMRVARIGPVAEELLPVLRVAPQQAPVFEPGEIVIVAVLTHAAKSKGRPYW
jgi:hypothetical protein